MSKLKKIRELQNLTQEELAEKSGISVRTIQRIEGGTVPKGYTLKALAKTLEIDEKELLSENEVANKSLESTADDPLMQPAIPLLDIRKIKLINLSSILFILVPPLNILVPLILTQALKQKNPITKQIISVQILWTLLAPILFFLGIFLKLGNSFTLVLMISIVLSNLYIILRNTAELDRKRKLRYILNFNFL
jgi:transcriptional regulator with XRE-family HTH domain